MEHRHSWIERSFCSHHHHSVELSFWMDQYDIESTH